MTPTAWVRLSGLFVAVSLLLACTPRTDSSSANAPVAEAGLATDQFMRSAMDSINQLIIRQPNKATLYEGRAHLFLGIDSLEAAERDLGRAVRLDSTNVTYRLELGDLLYRMMKVEEAYRQFGRAAELDPSGTAALLKQAEIQLVLRNYDKSMGLVNTALRKDQHAAHGYFLKGWIHMETGDTSLALSSFRTAVEQDNEDYPAYIMLGKISAALHDPLAEQYYSTAISLRPQSVEAWYNKGMYYQESGQDSLAMECYGEIKELDPGNALAWYNTGYILLEHLDDPAAAAREFAQAIQLEPGYTDAWYNKGLALERMDQLDSAAAYYRTSLTIQDDHDLAAQGMQRLADRGVKVQLPERRP